MSYLKSVPTPEFSQIDVARMWSSIKEHNMAVYDGTPCWQWIGTKRRSGWYGVFRVNGEQLPAHRAVYEHLIGRVPPGLVMDHLCKRKWCVNPAHVEPVTQRDNVARGESDIAKRIRQTECRHGHPFDVANTYISPEGFRGCRACRALRTAKYRAKKRVVPCTT